MRASQRAMMRRRRRTFLCAALLTLVGVVAAQRTGDAQQPAPAASYVVAAAPSPTPLEADARTVRSGTLAARMAKCPTGASACVDLTARIAWLQDDGVTTYGPVPIGHGKVDKPTPRGDFPVLWKTADYTSVTYDIPMPYSVFFAGDGIAFHQGKLNKPSHGCIHLTRAAARTFFNELDKGDRVVVRA